MLSNVLAKIKSAPKLAVLLLVVVAVVAALGFRAWSQQPKRFITVEAGSRSYHAAVADTDAIREKGLGGRRSLPSDQGMLFVFDDDAVHCFWMKDMHFPIDIIWLNADKQVVHIERNVSSDTYPHTFCPLQAARYVLELKGGQAKTAGLQQRSQLHF